MSINPIINYLRTHFQKNPVNVIEIGARYGESSKVILRTLHPRRFKMGHFKS